MPTRDVAQLILEVDARIATAQRAVNQLAKSIQQDSASMEQSLGKVATAHANVGKALNDNSRIRAGFTQLSFQIGDVTQQMSLGVAGARIFAQQSGQVIQALQVMGGEGNKFLQFLGGPWGIAISTAAVILAPLAAKLFDTGDETQKLVEKMREQARQTAETDQANKIFGHTLEGVEEALRNVEKAYAAYQDRLKSSSELQLEAARTALKNADAQRAVAQATLDAARAEIARQNALAIGPETKTGRADPRLVAADQARARIEAAQTTLNQANADIQRARRDIENFQSIVTVEKASASAADKIKQKYDDLIEKARQRALAEHKVGDELTRQVEQLTKARDAEIKALQGSSSSANRQSGRQIDFSQAEHIARAAGLQVNSGYRSPAEQARLFNDPSVNRPGNPVAPPGASAHNGANGKWAIDIQITDGVTPGKIRKIFGDQGVSLTKVLKEKGHFHIEGSRSEAAKAENDAARAQAKQVRNDNQFEEQRDRLNQELLQAQGQLIQGIAAQAQFAEDQVKADEARRDAAIQNDVEEQKLTQAQADQLKAINASIAAEKIKAIEIGKQVDLIRQQDEREQRKFEYQEDDLRFADEMARTQADHRKLQLEILDVVYQEKEAHLRALKAQLEVAGKLEEAADVQTQIDRLPTEKDHDRSRTLQGTMNPLEALANQAPKTAAEVIEAFQSIEAQGINSLADAIGEVVTGTKSLGAAFSDVAKSIIADIVRMTIKMLIFRALSSVLGLGGIGKPDIGATAAVNLGPIPDLTTNPGFPGFASGGSFVVGGRGGVDRNMLSINGRPAVRVSQGETVAVIPKAPRISLPAANSNARQTVELRIATDGNFRTEVGTVAGQVVVTAAPAIIKKARENTIQSLGRRSISGGR